MTLPTPRCLYPVRVRQDVPWDTAFPGEHPCGLPATHRLEVAFYLDGYSEPGVTRHKTRLFVMDLCDKHAEFVPSVQIIGPKAAEIVGATP